ncbi:hypothetical protein PAMP_024009 [Pampus punctatissimus]
MASESFQYRALFEYKRERGDDISLQPGDLLTVPKASLMAVAGPEYQEGDERSPKGWLHGTNERTKEKGDFPGTFVEYVGVVRVGPPAAKSWPRPVPPTPGGPQTAAGPQPTGAAAASEALMGVSVGQELKKMRAGSQESPVRPLTLTPKSDLNPQNVHTLKAKRFNESLQRQK